MSEFGVNEGIGLAFMIVGVVFDFFGCVGLVRFPDVYNRLQAATKCVTFGTCILLLGVAIYAADATSPKAIICAAFVLLTSPTAAHAIARAAHISGVKLWEKSILDRYEEDRDEEAEAQRA